MRRHQSILRSLAKMFVAGIVSLYGPTMAIAQSQIFVAHTGATDPTTEGFSITSYLGVGTAAPLTNDLGVSAWSITAPDNNTTQYGYASGAFSAAQQTDLENQGFTVTLVARAVQNYAVPFSASTPYPIMGVTVSPTTNRLYEVDFGLDASGNTIVVLPSVTVGGAGSSWEDPSSNLMVTVPGNGYHTYQLVVTPGTWLADLYIDGLDSIQGFSGTVIPGGSYNGYGMDLAAGNGGQANFNLIQLISGPELAVVIWPSPSPITYGTGLSTNQLNATANVPGSFAYSPPIGTLLNPGTNSLSVVFTPSDMVDYGSVTDIVSLVVLPAGFAEDQIKVHNTGVDDANNPLPPGDRDTHYTITSAPAGTEPTPFAPYVVNPNQYPFPYWLTDDATSQWVAVQSNYTTSTQDPAGLYDYQTSFDLTGLDPSTASLTFRIIGDNLIQDVRLNGISANLAIPPPQSFALWQGPYTISTNFVAGTNILDFIVNNTPPDGGNPSGLRIEISGVASNAAPVLSIYPAVEIAWNSRTNTAYQVQWSTNLLSTNWINLGDIISGTGNAISTFDSTRYSATRYYRIVVEP